MNIDKDADKSKKWFSIKSLFQNPTEDHLSQM
jgi:hypothetical protein